MDKNNKKVDRAKDQTTANNPTKRTFSVATQTSDSEDSNEHALTTGARRRPARRQNRQPRDESPSDPEALAEAARKIEKDRQRENEVLRREELAKNAPPVRTPEFEQSCAFARALQELAFLRERDATTYKSPEQKFEEDRAEFQAMCDNFSVNFEVEERLDRIQKDIEQRTKRINDAFLEMKSRLEENTRASIKEQDGLEQFLRNPDNHAFTVNSYIKTRDEENYHRHLLLRSAMRETEEKLREPAQEEPYSRIVENMLDRDLEQEALQSNYATLTHSEESGSSELNSEQVADKKEEEKKEQVPPEIVQLLDEIHANEPDQQTNEQQHQPPAHSPRRNVVQRSLLSQNSFSRLLWSLGIDTSEWTRQDLGVAFQDYMYLHGYWTPRDRWQELMKDFVIARRNDGHNEFEDPPAKKKAYLRYKDEKIRRGEFTE